jgi:hypothetical protein
MATGETFFRHHPPGRLREDVVLNDVTRLMCAGAYLDEDFARAAIAELVEDEHRAVAPSTGFDIEPVLRHCFQARAMRLARDVALTAVLVVGLLLLPGTIAVGLISLGIQVLIGIALWRRIPRARPLIATVAGLWLLCNCGSGVLLMLLPSRSIDRELSDTGLPRTPDVWHDPKIALVKAGILLVVAVSVLTWSKLRVYRVLIDDLARDRHHRLPAVSNERIRRRVARLATAQWGNLTLHADPSPFIGAGEVETSWSMSLQLRPAGSDPASNEYIAVDPVALHRHVRQRLTAMRGEALPERERISGLILLDYVVASGERERLDSLIEPEERSPYDEVSPDAIEAIIRHPQGSLRYYLRAVVGAEGKDVVTDDQRLVVPAQDQQITVSTFLYLAVEGGMLYAEFVATVLPPVNGRYSIIDRLVPDRVFVRALGESLAGLFLALPAAPVRMVRSLLTMLTYGRKMERADRASLEYRYYDYGARLSVRELASVGKLETYVQKLDAEKYYKLVERAVTSAVLDFLDTHGVDTAEYQARTNTVLNAGVIITGGTVSGPVAGGTGATATQNA